MAEAAGVSRQTVSNALNAPERLRPETLARVQTVIAQLDYRPNEAARSLRTRSSRLIGMRVSPVSNGTGVLDRFLHAMCENARERGYAVLAFAASNQDEEIAAYEDLLRRNAVDAFALTETSRGDPRARWLLSHGAEFVSFGRPWDVYRPRHSWVDVDGAAGTSAAVDHLVEQGHRRIAFLGWPEGSGSGDDRHAGWLAAVTAHRLARTDLVRRSEDGIAGGEAVAGAMLDQRRAPTGIVCASDTLAVGALRAVVERGLKPGLDIAVTGFDDSPIAAAASPALTSVRQPLETAAATLVEVIVEHVNGARTAPTHVLLPPSLTVRPSSQR
ncbi:MAG: LacI family DNA-binding transcriptional regulator [bacterium]